MFAKRLIKFAATFIVVLVIVAIAFAMSRYLRDSRLVREGNIAIAKVENFRTMHGRLPSELSEVGISSDGPLYYEMRGQDAYVIWYGKQLGESELYDSREKEWKAAY